MAHAALRVVVDRAIEEARKLPGLSAPADDKRPQEGSAIADHSYEDLLATAILNKVIERFQKERVDGNSNVLHEARPTKHAPTENEHDFEEGAGNCAPRSVKSNSDDGGTSVRRSGNHRAPVSFIMEERIEEVTTITSGGANDALEFGCSRRVPFPELGMDIVDPPRELPSPSPSSDSSDSNSNVVCSPRRVGMKKYHTASRPMDLVSPIESWEDNWLFQKRKTGRSQPGAVVMLVPSSNACYKALIGDRDAEDTSDLSECSSTKSDEEIERELMEAIDNVVPRAPKTTECNAGDNQEVPDDAARLEGVDEVDEACHVETKTGNNAAAGERFGEGGSEETRVSKEKTVEREDNKDNKSKQARSCLATRTSAKRVGNEIREKSKETSKRRGEIIVTAVESSAREDVKVHSEISSRRSDRGNAVDECEEQRDGEYTEHYDTAVQRHLDSLTKSDVSSEQCETTDKTRKELAEEESSELEDKSIEKRESERSEAEVQLPYAMVENCIDMTAESDRLSTPPRPGTIAEREHKKWENAPPIKNNPYSEESIRKRSWERRYSRKPADIPGTHYEITKLNEEANSEALLTPDLPDIKRFGRDYYINQSREAGEERAEQAKSAVSSSSRTSGSQRSSCAHNDEQREQQEEAKDTDGGMVPLSREDKDTRTTVSRWRNNAEVITPSETNNRAVSTRASVDIDRQRAISDKNAVEEEEGATSKVQQTDDILEDQRKNSKNEINAKLNNQEHNLEAECENDKERKVRKIDLKAYGFENEFPDQGDARRQERVVNRLDLRSFGYQDSLRRTRSNNQLGQPTNNEKSNLTRRVIGREGDFVGGSKECPVDAPKSLGCGDPAKGSHELNVLRDKIEKVDSLISAKSMPNVADDVYYYANPVRVSDDNDDDEENELIARNFLDRASDRSEEGATDTRNDGSLSGYDEIPSDVDKSFEDIYIRSKEPCRESDDEKLAMPSVKKLAEAFSGRQASAIEAAPVKISRALINMTDDSKNGSSTPEVQVVEAPRQMHSLTARSLSKEFREGLRQKTAKATSPSVNRSLMEERPGIVRAKQSKSSDTAVISPGKLKSNIIFWEQMQKRN